jgi:two-component system sensor histidine kinase BaeS
MNKLNDRRPGCTGPPWSWRYRRDASSFPHRSGWENKRRFLFFRFAGFLAVAVLLFTLGLVGLVFLLARVFLGDGQAATLVAWLAGCGLVLLIPLVVGSYALRSFSRFVNPLARVMAAADVVAEGDFSVRVPEGGAGEVGRLARSFNRMVAELERSDLQRRNLTADVAHELRTPLHIIQGNLEGILDGVYEPTPDQLNLLLDETRHLTLLVEDLRTLSLAEAGQLHLELETLDVEELLSDVATSFSGQAEAAGIVLQLESEQRPEPLTIQGDASRLDQVLSNLIANALRHTPSGGRITLSAHLQAGGVRIQVSDNGEGIPAEDLPYVFERFWQSDPERKRGTGSGLGLAIVRQLVQAHGGRITAQSSPGQGTTFSIDLPSGTPE